MTKTVETHYGELISIDPMTGDYLASPVYCCYTCDREMTAEDGIEHIRTYGEERETAEMAETEPCNDCGNPYGDCETAEMTETKTEKRETYYLQVEDLLGGYRIGQFESITDALAYGDAIIAEDPGTISIRVVSSTEILDKMAGRVPRLEEI